MFVALPENGCGGVTGPPAFPQGQWASWRGMVVLQVLCRGVEPSLFSKLELSSSGDHLLAGGVVELLLLVLRLVLTDAQPMPGR